MVPILRKVGPKLEKLVLDGCAELGDETFNTILDYCPNLHHLSLALLDAITDACVAEGFGSWRQNHGLRVLDLTRCMGIKDTGVQAILAHSGVTLQFLSLNSLDELTQETFKLLMDPKSNIGDELVEMDVGFVRCVNDDVIVGLSDACRALRTLKVVVPVAIY